MAKRKRRSFSKEYKAEVVELIRKSGQSGPRANLPWGLVIVSLLGP